MAGIAIDHAGRQKRHIVPADFGIDVELDRREKAAWRIAENLHTPLQRQDGAVDQPQVVNAEQDAAALGNVSAPFHARWRFRDGLIAGRKLADVAVVPEHVDARRLLLEEARLGPALNAYAPIARGVFDEFDVGARLQ
ncbi:MAG TPA: hypothetical protein VGR45_06885, partial [Stellaceae bacterium]|nr:hypothetical protein [Stellaceae bacterium]